MEKEMSLLEIFQVLKKRITTLSLIIIGFVVVGGGIGFLLNEKEYVSTATLAVGTESERNTEEYNSLTGEPIQETYIKYGDYKISQEEGKFYKEVIRSSDLLEQVNEQAHVNWSIDDLKSNVLIDIPEESSSIILSVHGQNKEEVYVVMEQIVEVFQKENYEITGMENIKVVDSASTPKEKNTVDRVLYILLSIFFGVIVAIITVLILELLDNTVKNEKDIIKLNLSVLGTVRRHTFDEDLKNIRTKIKYSNQFEDKKSLLIATFNQEVENISIKLAEVLALNKDKTLLIDADFRKPIVNKMLDLENTAGLSNLLESTVDVNKITQDYTKNYQIITTGTSLNQPSEKLSNDKMQNLLVDFREEYSYVVINGHPMTDVTDSIALSTLTDGVILQVKINQTDLQDIKEIKETLSEIKVEILGVVLVE